jgi:hypothetical protein
MNMLVTTPFGQHKWMRGTGRPAPARSTAEDYRARAAECQEIAARSREQIRQQYEELARQWLVLAAQAENRP